MTAKPLRGRLVLHSMSSPLLQSTGDSWLISVGTPATAVRNRSTAEIETEKFLVAKKKKRPQKLQRWIDARKKYKLSHAQIQMARELGMNPERFGKLDNHHQQKWKLPLGAFIEECYLKRFGHFPDKVLSIEDRIRIETDKKIKKREAKALETTDSPQGR